MILDKPVGHASFKRQVYPNPNFGRWFYTTATGTALNFVQYDTTQVNKQRVVTKSSLTGNNVIVATSPNFDCAVTFVAGASLSVFWVNLTDYTIPNAV